MCAKEDNKGESLLTRRAAEELAILKRHIEILQAVIGEQPIGIIKLSDKTKHLEHKVRYSLRVLEQEGLIEASREGAVTTKKLADYLKELREKVDDMSKSLDRIRDAIGETMKSVKKII